VKKIIKLTSLAAVVLLNITPAHAEPYVGLNLGGSWVAIAKRISYTNGQTNISNSYSGVRGQIALGYNFHLRGASNFSNDVNGATTSSDDFSDRKQPVYNDNPMVDNCGLDDIFFAIEVDGNYVNGIAQANESPFFLTTNSTVKEQMQYSYDIFVIPKYRYSPSILLFAGPGFSEGRFQVQTPSLTSGNMGATADATTWLAGWSIKAGIETPVTNSMNLVFTYQYTNYQSVNLRRIEPLTGETVTANYKPVVNSVTIGLNWG
jgi:opacity protein-like surface antigen